MDFIDIARWIIPYFLIATAFALWDGRQGWPFGYPADRALWWPRTIARAFLEVVARWAEEMWNDREVLGPYDPSKDNFMPAPVAVLDPLPCGGTHKRHLFLKAQFCQRGCGAVNPDWKGGTAFPTTTATPGDETFIHIPNTDEPIVIYSPRYSGPGVD